MAKKINEVTKVTYMNTDDYVLMNTSGGITVQIKKAEFANAIMEAMGTATRDKNGLMSPAIFNLLPYSSRLSGNELIHLSTGLVWERQFVNISISDSGTTKNAFMILSATLPGATSTTPFLGKNSIGNFPSTAKLLYKIENGRLDLYLYGKIGLDSSMGIIIQSNTMRPKNYANIADISEYTEIAL